jgi:hypothetical protein
MEGTIMDIRIVTVPARKSSTLLPGSSGLPLPRAAATFNVDRDGDAPKAEQS